MGDRGAGGGPARSLANAGRPSSPLRRAPVLPFWGRQSSPGRRGLLCPPHQVRKDASWLPPHPTAQTPATPAPLLPGPGPRRPRPFLSPTGPPPGSQAAPLICWELSLPLLISDLAIFCLCSPHPCRDPPTPLQLFLSALAQPMSGSGSKAELTPFSPNPPPAVLGRNKPGVTPFAQPPGSNLGHPRPSQPTSTSPGCSPPAPLTPGPRCHPSAG